MKTLLTTTACLLCAAVAVAGISPVENGDRPDAFRPGDAVEGSIPALGSGVAGLGALSTAAENRIPHVVDVPVYVPADGGSMQPPLATGPQDIDFVGGLPRVLGRAPATRGGDGALGRLANQGSAQLPATGNLSPMQLSTVPEPSTYLLGVVGLTLVLAVRRQVQRGV
jgi:hypothetical protein